MSEFDAQEILNALPTEYHLIDLESKKIIQSNNKNIEPGTPCYKAICNNDRPCIDGDEKCICAQNLKRNNTTEIIIEKECKDGLKFYRITGKLLRKNKALLNYEEITEQAKLKEEVKHSNKRMEIAERLANFGYWEMDAETKIIRPSYGSLFIYGVHQEFITLEEVITLTLPEYQKGFRDSFDKLLKEGLGFDIKFRIQRPSDKAIRYLHATADYKKGQQMVYGIILDITESVEARDAIVENEKYLNLLFRSTNSAFAQHKIITNEKGEPVDYIFLDINPRFEEFTGLKKEQLLNKTVKEVLPNTEDFWIERYGKVALTGEPMEFTDYSLELDKYYEVSAFSPKKNYFAVSFSDVTERQKAQRALEEAKERAEEADRLKTLFLANMSHEIRTPLNGILGFSNLLTAGDVEKSQREYFGKIIENSGKRLITVIDDIINISMIQSNQFRVEYGQFDIVELLKELFVVYQEQYEEKLADIDFQLQLYSGCSQVAIFSDKHRVYQVVKNLLDNAFKFTSEGYIEFGLREADLDTIHLFVNDTGIGIDKNRQEIIFDVFRQAEEGQSRKYEGSGLGLAIVSGIVEKLNGDVKVKSERGVGSQFDVVFPRNTDKKDATKLSSEAYCIRTENTSLARKIVSFEDDKPSAEFMKTIVESIGCQLTNFESAKEGISFIRKNEVDLIFMDVQLPEMNGYEATKLIKSEFSDIPVIMQTAFAMSGDKEKAMAAGCNNYLTKPLTRDVMLQTIGKFLKVENKN